MDIRSIFGPPWRRPAYRDKLVSRTKSIGSILFTSRWGQAVLIGFFLGLAWLLWRRFLQSAFELTEDELNELRAFEEYEAYRRQKEP